ncbi:MAG TPA: hypothetical protein VMU70_00655 [Candidatus Tyrphobacter sp.]|nr:hypothetical protein [Candidatus Tyrphobacter sp.]
MNTPKIILEKWSAKKDIRLFVEFLNHPSFPQHRKIIFRAFPELRAEINTGAEEEKVVKEFILGFNKLNKKRLDAVVKRNTRLAAPKMPGAIKILSRAMEYEWNKNTAYRAVPTILPFSPLSKRIFYFSILGEVLAGKKSRIILTSAHEISHFIFFNLLKKAEAKLGFKLSSDATHYLKESLTAALLNEEPIKSSLGIGKYLGNPEIRHIYINFPGQQPILFTNLISKLYRDSRRRGRSFNDWLIYLITVVHLRETAFSKKRKLWNKYGEGIVKIPKQFNQYQTPIVFK